MHASEVADPRLLVAGSGSRRPNRAEGRPRPPRPLRSARARSMTVAGALLASSQRPRPFRSGRARAVRAALALALALTCWLAQAAGADARDREPPVAAPAAPRVGLQVGHWRIDELPDDEARLRGQTGGSGGGYREVDVNLAVVERTAAVLTARGVTVDILPATVPLGYRADVFLAIHCDASGEPGVRGYKLARYRNSLIPERDDALIGALSASYAAATRLPLDANVTRNMTGYYAYNATRFVTVIDRLTPSALIELGFLTNPGDRAVLVQQQDLVAAALADGIMRYLAAPSSAPPRRVCVRNCITQYFEGDDFVGFRENVVVMR